jgi:hypothetical protein
MGATAYNLAVAGSVLVFAGTLKEGDWVGTPYHGDFQRREHYEAPVDHYSHATAMKEWKRWTSTEPEHVRNGSLLD